MYDKYTQNFLKFGNGNVTAIAHPRFIKGLHHTSHPIRHTNIRRFRRAMAQIEADGEVTDEDEQSMMQFHRSLTIPLTFTSPTPANK